MEHIDTAKIAEALKLLDAAATQTKDELKTVLSDKFTNLRKLIMEHDTGASKSLAAARNDVLDVAARIKNATVAKACAITRTVDTSVHESPWAYIAGAAAAGVLLGFSLGRSRK